MSFKPEYTRLTEEWIDGNTIHKAAQIAESADLGFADSLCQSILDAFTDVWQRIRRLSTIKPKERRQFKSDLGQFCLWMDCFSPGQLSKTLTDSRELEGIVLETLCNIGRLLVVDFYPLLLREKKHNNQKDQKENLSDLIEKAEQADLIAKFEQLDSESGSSSDSDALSKSQGVSPVSGYVIGIKKNIQQLMQLLPTLERTLELVSFAEHNKRESRPALFIVSTPAAPYIQQIREKFPQAKDELVDRFGEANWQRHIAIREQMDNKDHSDIHQHDKTSHTGSLFQTISLFHDSGIGSLNQAASSDAQSVASHTSFLSSHSAQDRGVQRVPRTPQEITEGRPFDCSICGHILSNLKNRIDWKIHVFADIKPYLCAFPNCKDSLKLFPTRKLWAKHDLDQHRTRTLWRCPECTTESSSPEAWESHLLNKHETAFSGSKLMAAVTSAEASKQINFEKELCPFCSNHPGSSARAFATHVGRHMEEIALASLPKEYDDVTDSESHKTRSDDNVDVIVSQNPVTHIGEDIVPRNLWEFSFDDTALNHPAYELGPSSDGFWTCPQIADDIKPCNHKPTRIRSDFIKQLDTHFATDKTPFRREGMGQVQREQMSVQDATGRPMQPNQPLPQPRKRINFLDLEGNNYGPRRPASKSFSSPQLKPPSTSLRQSGQPGQQTQPQLTPRQKSQASMPGMRKQSGQQDKGFDGSFEQRLLPKRRLVPDHPSLTFPDSQTSSRLKVSNGQSQTSTVAQSSQTGRQQSQLSNDQELTPERLGEMDQVLYPGNMRF